MNPFYWTDKQAAKLIRDRVTEYGSGLAVYHALCQVASDEESETFTTSHKWLAFLSGFQERTVASRLKDLASIGAISISTPRLRTASTFRLLAIGNSCKTFCNHCRTFCNGEGVAVASRRSTATTKRKTGKKAAVTEEWFQELASETAYRHLSIPVERSKAEVWIKANPEREFTQRFFIGWLNRAKPTGSNGSPVRQKLQRELDDLKHELARTTDAKKGADLESRLASVKTQLEAMP